MFFRFLILFFLGYQEYSTANSIPLPSILNKQKFPRNSFHQLKTNFPKFNLKI